MWLQQNSRFVLPPNSIRINEFGANNDQNQNQNIVGGSSCLEATSASENTDSPSIENEYVVTGTFIDGSKAFVSLWNIRYKAYNIPAFLTDAEIFEAGGNPEELKAWEAGRSPDGKLNRDDPEQEAEYYRARDKYFAKVPKKLIRVFAKKLLETGADSKATVEKGQMGIQRTPGSIAVIFSERKVVFRDNTGEIKTGAILSGTRQRGQWSNFVESGRDTGVYTLFPGDKR